MTGLLQEFLSYIYKALLHSLILYIFSIRILDSALWSNGCTGGLLLLGNSCCTVRLNFLITTLETKYSSNSVPVLRDNNFSKSRTWVLFVVWDFHLVNCLYNVSVDVIPSVILFGKFYGTIKKVTSPTTATKFSFSL